MSVLTNDTIDGVPCFVSKIIDENNILWGNIRIGSFFPLNNISRLKKIIDIHTGIFTHDYVNLEVGTYSYRYTLFEFDNDDNYSKGIVNLVVGYPKSGVTEYYQADLNAINDANSTQISDDPNDVSNLHPFKITHGTIFFFIKMKNMKNKYSLKQYIRVITVLN